MSQQKQIKRGRGRPVEKVMPCIVWGCREKIKARGYCVSHYHIQRKYGGHIPAGYKPKPRARCSTEGCHRPVQSLSLCDRHYQQQRYKNLEQVVETRINKSNRDAKIISLRKKGGTYKAIAKTLNTTPRIVGIVCRNHQTHCAG